MYEEKIPSMILTNYMENFAYSWTTLESTTYKLYHTQILKEHPTSSTPPKKVEVPAKLYLMLL